MSPAATTDRREELHRRGLALEWFTVAWNVVEGFVAVGAGLVTGCVSLIGFGADSFIEVISAVALAMLPVILWQGWETVVEAREEREA